MSWKRMKGIIEEIVCPKCHGTFSGDDYDWDEDMCLHCLFPQAAKSRPVPIDHSHGYNRNVTKEGQQLNNLEYTKEKQSKQAEKAKLEYDYGINKRKTYK